MNNLAALYNIHFLISLSGCKWFTVFRVVRGATFVKRFKDEMHHRSAEGYFNLRALFGALGQGSLLIS